jgi:hypothetical protein
MLKDNKFFKHFYWPLVRFLGLNQHQLSKREKSRAALLFLLVYVLGTASFLFEWYRTDDLRKKIDGFEIFPVIVSILIEMANFTIKSQQIELFFIDLENNFAKIESTTNFERSFKIFKSYFILMWICNNFVALFSIIFFLFTGQTAVLCYIPFQSGPLFFIIWLMNSAFTIYGTNLNLIVDVARYGCVMFLSGLVKDMRRKLKDNRISDYKTYTESVLELRRMIKAYERLFSTIVALRAFIGIASGSVVIMAATHEVGISLKL